MNYRRISPLVLVVVAGEAIFMAPFLIPRLYRPLMLAAWNLNNTNFGTAFAAYGVTAMFSYLLGGPFADKYRPAPLISISLVLTALASLHLALFPSELCLVVTYAFFGASTILLMWGVLIKTIHVAGGEERRSLAMSVLDAGRGFSAAAFSSVLILLVTLLVPDLAATARQIKALRIIYFATASFTLLIAGGVWISLKGFRPARETQKRWTPRQALDGLRDQRVWLLSVVILGSYCGYKGIDNYATYLVDVYKMDLSTSSIFTSMVFWLRPVAALAAGAGADRCRGIHKNGRFAVLFVLLFLCGLSQLLLAFAAPASFHYAFATVLLSASLAYALRAVYFSVFGDLRVREHLTGTITGIVSFVGFMPDIFFGLVTGRLIDAYPGAQGFQLSFAFTAVGLWLGAAASFLLCRKVDS